MFKWFNTENDYTNGFYDAYMGLGLIIGGIGFVYKILLWAITKCANRNK